MIEQVQVDILVMDFMKDVGMSTWGLLDHLASPFEWQIRGVAFIFPIAAFESEWVTLIMYVKPVGKERQ